MTPPQAESATLPLDEALYRRPSMFQIWWKILLGMTSTWRELAKANALIDRLEAGELAQELTATRAIKKLEQAIIKAGESKKTSKTLRHELLALLDKEYHQELTEHDS